MSLSELIVLGLATWRIADLLHYGRGPYGVFTRLRGRLRVSHDEDGEPVAWPDTEMGRLLRCLDCGSVWVGTGLVGLYLWSPWVAVILALPFALSAMAIGVAKAVK